MAHGKCLKGNHILVWGAPPLVRVAYCPLHDFPLALASLHALGPPESRLPVDELRPLVGPGHTTNGNALKMKVPK